MNKRFLLKILRKGYNTFCAHKVERLNCEKNPDVTSEIVYQQLKGAQPCMVARFGSVELNCILNYLSIRFEKHSAVAYIKGKSQGWWWDEKIVYSMQNNAGFYPTTDNSLKQFCELMIRDMCEVDVLGSWQPGEREVLPFMNIKKLVSLLTLEPYWSKNPWTRVLEGKNVLVIHPFAKLIEEQYRNKRKMLFSNSDVLPEFNLMTIQAVQSIGGECNEYENWFDALNWMKQEMDRKDYDIALIGCGAYGFPLAAHAKRTGHKAVHLGGALQLMFGIKGRRWEDPNYGEKTLGKKGCYTSLMNDYWVRPSIEETPRMAKNVEDGCYW